MADVSKAQKLASARKKFKELKKERRKNTSQKVNENVESTSSSREETPVDNVMSAIQETELTNQLPNYFNVTDEVEQPLPIAFFDTFMQNNGNSSSQAGFINSYFNQEDHKNNDEVNNFQAFNKVELDENSTLPTQLSSVESLRQLSNEMAELINTTTDNNNPEDVVESLLEIRNQELAALLSEEKMKRQQLEATLEEYEKKLVEMEHELREKDLNVNTKVETDMSRLREELQCHVQTVGILVGEKAELVANLNQFQLVAKQKTSECEELQGRLKTSRSRVADLEREINMLKNERSQFDNLGREQISELEKLKSNYQILKDDKDEFMQDLLEVREKLKTSSDNNLNFQQQIAELTNQLSLANIKIQQLTNGELDQSSGQVEHLTQEKFALEKQVSNLNQTVKTLSKEREESSLQYQQYAQQLNAQITNMASRLEKLQRENELLQIQEQNRIKHIGELEKQLQNLQNDQINFAIQKNPNSDSKAELDAALELIEKMKIDNVELQDENVKIFDEKESLLTDLKDKDEKITKLEETIVELRSSRPDNVKLLAIMESDKVAAARAVAQNTDLKTQLESMQEVFMKLNNDKIELTENLTTAQKNNKELLEKLQKTEIHLQTLADAIEIKDKELSNLRENSLELDKQFLQSEQLTDRLRHYEAQDHSSQALQNELQESKQLITKLTEEIRHLKDNNPDDEASRKELQDSREIIAKLTEEINSLKKSSSERKERLEGLNLKNKELDETDTNHNDFVLDKESAMKHLEAKFLKTMEDIATITEEKQRLEHLVLQLQGETETIGEYVALYQHQRSLLKQKAIEKDQQLTQLANDREQMKAKLEKLNNLVTKLILEKGAVPPELLEHHSNSDNHLCEEHAKINSELNKIAQSSFTIKPTNGENQSNTETAEEIISLLSEIKSSNLIQPTENFHHCPWCSGQLITV